MAAKARAAVLMWAGLQRATRAATCGEQAPDRENLLLQRRFSTSHKKASLQQSLSNEQCHTLLEGEPCYRDVLWAMTHGIYDFPHLYPETLSRVSSFEEFQGHLHGLNPALCPAPCVKHDKTSGSLACAPHAVPWDLLHSSLAHVNLGGLGPDAGTENIRYQRVGNTSSGQSAEARPFDLVITANGPYQCYSCERNGLAGSFGIVNVKTASSVALTFSLEDTETGEPVVLEGFHFTLFDVDQSRKSSERAVVAGFSNYTLSEGTEVDVSEVAGGTALIVESTRFGAGCDNPKDPLQLGEVNCKGQTVDQRKRSVTFLFENVSSFDIELEARCKGRRCRGRRCQGRNFLFAGSSALAKSCQEILRPGLCAAFGDPHFVTFDGAHTVFLGHQTLWLVRSRDVWIQAESMDSDGKLQGLAVSGPFISNHSLLLRKLNATTLQASFDGQEILAEAQADFQVTGIMEAHRRTGWNTSLHSQDVLAVRTQIQFAVGPWPERFLKQPVGGLFVFRFPGGIEVTLTGVDFMTVVITMPPAIDGQGGYCGNFNGDAMDDFEYVGPSFHKPVGQNLGPVDPSESLFGSSHLSALQQDTQTHRIDPERVLADCQTEVKAMAEQKCRAVAAAQLKRDCIFEVCATGLVSSADSVVAAELLETKVNARGIPLLVGSGQCLDAVGRHYVAVDTSFATAEGCTDLLRSLALTGSVLGAQLRRGGRCQVLIEQGAEISDLPKVGAWGHLVDEHAKGEGIICDTTEDSDWTCWQLV